MKTRGVATVLMLVIGVAANLLASQATPKPDVSSVAGAWTISVAGMDQPMSAGMTLTQDGAKVKGTFTSDHTGECPLEGQFTGGTLTFSITMRGGADGTMRVDFTGKMKADGTLDGTLNGQMGEMKWSATRKK
jgi:hypothetical protein